MQNSPIRFASSMAQLPPYLFGTINQIKMQKRWEGLDVIDLGMGNPLTLPRNRLLKNCAMWSKIRKAIGIP